MFRNTLFIILMAVVLIFVIQNTEVVEFRFLFWRFSISRALMLFGTLAVGFVAGWLLSFPKRKQHRIKGAK
ncbi:MAG: LapA family protein [Desulfobacterales bacterium]|nr:MAG: LapA family protein [Desulfobacterales bacterium]